MPSEHLAQQEPAGASEARVRYSVVVPVYGNEQTLTTLLAQIAGIARDLDGALEVVFVVDGSPDGSLIVLRRFLSEPMPFTAQLIALSRNFGSFSAIMVGLAAAEGDFVAIMSADLQEPIELVRDFFSTLASGDYDITVGVRAGRSDPLTSMLASRAFWSLSRRFVQPELPRGGADVFGCTRQVASHLIRLQESHSSLIGLLYWLGFRRVEVPYTRQARTVGKTAWGFRRKLRYLLDSIFSFTDLPVMVITAIGLIGIVVSCCIGVAVFVAWLTSDTQIAGYTPLMLAIVFTASSVLVSLGVIGSFVWRTYENTKGRPNAIPMSHERFRSTDSQR